MPAPISTNFDVGSAETGSTGPEASPAAFGGQVDQSLEQAGGDIRNAARATARGLSIHNSIQKQAQHVADTNWASTAYESEKLGLAKFMSDPANNQADNFSDKIQTYLQSRNDQYAQLDPQPSPKAMQMFHDTFSRYSSEKVADSYRMDVNNKVKNGITNTSDQISNAVESYREMSGIPGYDASKDLADSYMQISSGIEKSFRDFSPNVADQLQTEVAKQSVVAMMDNNPKGARTLLDNVSTIDPELRKSLNREIDTAQFSQNVVERDAFNRTRDDHLKNAMMGNDDGTPVLKIPIETYQQWYPPEKAEAAKEADDNHIDTYNKANSIYQDLSDKQANYQKNAVNDLFLNRKDVNDQDIFSIVHQRIQQNMEMQDKDPVKWLQTNNPSIKALQDAYQHAPDDQKAGAMASLNDAILKFQGMPDAGASDKEKAMYLDKPINDRHLMGIDNATQNASFLNNATPTEFIKKMGDIMGQYPDSDHQYTAFNDLVTMPSKGEALKQEYQFAWQNKDAWWLGTYVGALGAGKGVAVPEDKNKEIQKVLNTNPTWNQFRSTMIGDNFQRGEQIAGFQQGLQKLSEAFVTQGTPPTAAVDKAANLLIKSTMGFTKVNGNPMMLLRDQGGSAKLDQPGIDDIGRRLSLSLRDIDVSKIDEKPFLPLHIFGKDPDAPGRQEALKNYVTANTFFQTGPDGQSASLYAKDANGQAFQIRDTDNKPFNMKFADLPKYTYTNTPNSMMFTDDLPHDDSPTVLKSHPFKTYPTPGDMNPTSWHFDTSAVKKWWGGGGIPGVDGRVWTPYGDKGADK